MYGNRWRTERRDGPLSNNKHSDDNCGPEEDGQRIPGAYAISQQRRMEMQRMREQSNEQHDRRNSSPNEVMEGSELSSRFQQIEPPAITARVSLTPSVNADRREQPPPLLSRHGMSLDRAILSLDQTQKSPWYKRKWVIAFILIACCAVVGGAVAAVLSTSGGGSSEASNDVVGDTPNTVTPDPFVQCEQHGKITKVSDDVKKVYDSLRNYPDLREHLTSGMKMSSCDPENVALMWASIENAGSKVLTIETVIGRLVLVMFYARTEGKGWEVKTNWLSRNSVCTWHGVECSNGDQRKIKSLILSGNNLQGTLESRLALLPVLQHLELDINDIGGTIPMELWQHPILGK